MLRACLITASLTVFSACQSTAAEDAPRPLVFGVNRVADPHVLYNPPDYDEHVYRRIREVGGTCVRILASPREIERERGHRDWKDFDRDLKLAIKYEQEPIVLIANTPAWASVNGKDTHEYPYKTELLPEFADFCADLARRTKGKARMFQFWNEPNGCGWVNDNCSNMDGYPLYTKWLKRAYLGIKSGNPKAVVGAGVIDYNEGVKEGWKYIEGIYNEGGGSFFDAVVIHPYAKLDEGVHWNAIRDTRDLMVRRGDARKPIWIDEWGWWNADSPEAVKRATEFLTRMSEPQYDYVTMCRYLIVSPLPDGGYGLCNRALEPYPIYEAFKSFDKSALMK